MASNQPERVRTEYVERQINPELFADHGVPAVGGLSVTEDTQTDAGEQILQLGAALKEYRCRLNAAGRALIPDFAPVASCEELPPVAAPTPNG